MNYYYCVANHTTTQLKWSITQIVGFLLSNIFTFSHWGCIHVHCSKLESCRHYRHCLLYIYYIYLSSWRLTFDDVEDRRNLTTTQVITINRSQDTRQFPGVLVSLQGPGETPLFNRNIIDTGVTICKPTASCITIKLRWTLGSGWPQQRYCVLFIDVSSSRKVIIFKTI